jgi:hypothetical protein
VSYAESILGGDRGGVRTSWPFGPRSLVVERSDFGVMTLRAPASLDVSASRSFTQSWLDWIACRQQALALPEDVPSYERRDGTLRRWPNGATSSGKR